jgi:arginyl-tRNA synthetase
MALDIRQYISKELEEHLAIPSQKLLPLLEVPKEIAFGDFAVPCFVFAKEMRKRPAEIAHDFSTAFSGAFRDRGAIRHAEARGPYLNIFVNRAYFVRELLRHFFGTDPQACRNAGMGKTVVIDYSSPNIAKPFGIGHLRSTVIGSSLKKIYEFLGYRVIGINHLGDWGTQFGKLITAFKKWGDEKKLDRNPVQYLYSLYVKYHEEAASDPGINGEARNWFKRLEEGDPDALKLWERFKTLSLDDFHRIYERLDVDFAYFTGESFYRDKIDQTIQEVKNSGITRESEGALVVPLEEDLPPALLRKSDSATLYLTRDIAAALYRYRNYHFDLSLYVVGSPQTLHFRQLFKVLKKMGCSWYSHCHHVPFGQIRFEDRSMSTRKGNVVFLEEVLDKAVKLARGIIDEKNPHLRNKDEVAEAVGVGAIIFNDLKSGRIRDITFNWDEMLNFNGETGPYLQYTYARIQSLLNKYRETYGQIRFNDGLPFGEEGYELALQLNNFDTAVCRAAQEFEPSVISRSLLDLASQFNSFYNAHRVVSDDRELSLARVLLVWIAGDVLGKGLSLLGMRPIEEM